MPAAVEALRVGVGAAGDGGLYRWSCNHTNNNRDSLCLNAIKEKSSKLHFLVFVCFVFFNEKTENLELLPKQLRLIKFLSNKTK